LSSRPKGLLILSLVEEMLIFVHIAVNKNFEKKKSSLAFSFQLFSSIIWSLYKELRVFNQYNIISEILRAQVQKSQRSKKSFLESSSK